MVKTYRVHVRKAVAQNPVAQAVARQALQRSVTDQKIALLLLQHGDPCAEVLSGIASLLQAVHLAAQIEHMSGPSVGVVKGGLNACLQVVMADSYDSLQTQAISGALDRALELAKKLKPDSVNQAWLHMSRG